MGHKMTINSRMVQMYGRHVPQCLGILHAWHHCPYTGHSVLVHRMRGITVRTRGTVSWHIACVASLSVHGAQCLGTSHAWHHCPYTGHGGLVYCMHGITVHTRAKYGRCSYTSCPYTSCQHTNCPYTSCTYTVSKDGQKSASFSHLRYENSNHCSLLNA